MPMVNLHSDFLGFKLNSCDVKGGKNYILVFDGCQRKFTEAGDITGDQELVFDSVTGELTITGIGGNSVDLSPICDLCGSGDLLIEILYSELLTLIDNDLLIPGMKYKIMDYQTTEPIANTFDGAMYTADIEPIIVTAISINELSEIAISAVHKSDILTYNVNDNKIIEGGDGYIEQGYVEGNILISPSSPNTIILSSILGDIVIDSDFYFYIVLEDDEEIELYQGSLGTNREYVTTPDGKVIITLLTNVADVMTFNHMYLNGNILIGNKPGSITYRRDEEKQIETNYDFRGVRVRLYANDLHTKAYDAATEYNPGQFVTYSGLIYVCMSTALGQTPSFNSIYRTAIAASFEGQYYSVDNNDFGNGIIIGIDDMDFVDYPIFTDTTGVYDDTNVMDFKHTTRNKAFPALIGSTSSGPKIRNVELNFTDNFVFAQHNGGEFENSKINNSWRSLLIQNTVGIVAEKGFNRVILTNCRNGVSFINADRVKIRGGNNIQIDQAEQIALDAPKNFKGSFMRQTIIGSAGGNSENVTFNVMNDVIAGRLSGTTIGGVMQNSRFVRMTDSTVNGFFFQNIFTRGAIIDKSEFKVQFRNNTMNLVERCSIMNGAYNVVTTKLINLTIEKEFIGNYITFANDVNDIISGTFGVFSSNGTADIPLKFRTEDFKIFINYFSYNNHTDGFSNIRLNDVIATQITYNNFTGLNYISDININTLSQNAINEVQILRSSFNEISYCSLTGGIEGITGGRMIDITVDDMLNTHIIGVFNNTNISTATHVKAEYGTTVQRNSDNTSYSVSWIESTIGLEYANVTS